MKLKQQKLTKGKFGHKRCTLLTNLGPSLSPRHPAIRKLGRDEAEAIAIQALGFIATDERLLSRFLALSGLDPANLRAAAARPGFFGGVLDFIAGDEKTLLDFAAACDLTPETAAAAHRVLSADSPPRQCD